MSEATPRREWRFYLDDTVRNIELIGEAATHIPDAERASSAQIPWRMLIATRNQLIRGYLGIDKDTLWSIVDTDTPKLLEQLRGLKASTAFHQ